MDLKLVEWHRYLRHCEGHVLRSTLWMFLAQPVFQLEDAML